MTHEFERFASLDRGISSTTLGRYNAAVSRYINPTIIEERKMNVASMDVFSRLMMDRIIFLGVLFLASVDSKADISLYLNTPGGQVSSGLAIYDTMQLIAPPVGTICTGMAASMGAILLCAGEKGKRAALPHSRILIHQPLGGAKGQASDILIAAEQIVKTRTELCEIIAERAGQPFDTVLSDVDRDYWMTSSEALEYGMIDKILAKK